MGQGACPVLARVRSQVNIDKKLSFSRDVFGPCPPSVFVGDYGWPNVAVGPLVSVNDELNAAALDDPGKWFDCSYNEIIEFRSSLARGMKTQHVKARNRVLADLQESVLSTAPVDFEVRFKNVPRLQLSFSSMLAPMGPSGEMESMRVAGAPKIPRKVDSIVNEGLRVSEAVPELLVAGADYYYLQKLLSSGLLGREEAKVIVPTRRSITATDSLLANLNIRKIKELPALNEILVFSVDHLFNHYVVLLLPGAWEFEQFEAWSPGTVWTGGESETKIAHEYEPFWGRSDYAESEGGGYYSGRLACTELLLKLGRQARVIVFREIGPEYKVPTGVWQVREGMRHLADKPPLKAASLSEALNLLSAMLRVHVSEYVKKSDIIRQKSLLDY